MRIAICSEVLPPIVDGVTHTLSELVTTLRDSAIEFLFVSAVKPSADLSWRDRVHSVAGVPLPIYPNYRLGFPRARALDPVLDRFAPDLVHVVTPSLLGNYGVRYARRRSLPVVASFHANFAAFASLYILPGLEGLAWRCLRWFYNRCDLTMAPSESMAEELRRHGIRNVRLWPRGVDRRRFSPSFRSVALRDRIGADGVPVLLYVGRLAKEKNLDLLATAIQLLHSRGDRFKLVIVGEGPMRAELQARLPGAHFTGQVEGEELARWYASADVFVFPSTIESFGNVVLEAFASGLPVVGVAKGGVRDLVQPGWNGVLVSPDGPSRFADSVHALIDTPAEISRLAGRALQTAGAYRWPEANRLLLDAYEEVVAARQQGGRMVADRSERFTASQ